MAQHFGGRSSFGFNGGGGGGGFNQGGGFQGAKKSSSKPPCKFFPLGQCREGANCRFSHDVAPTGSGFGGGFSAPQGFSHAAAPFGVSQGFQHQPQQQQQQSYGHHGNKSAQPCRFFPLGTCRDGARCKYSHDVAAVGGGGGAGGGKKNPKVGDARLMLAHTSGWGHQGQPNQVQGDLCPEEIAWALLSQGGVAEASLQQHRAELVQRVQRAGIPVNGVVGNQMMASGNNVGGFGSGPMQPPSFGFPSQPSSFGDPFDSSARPTGFPAAPSTGFPPSNQGFPMQEAHQQQPQQYFQQQQQQQQAPTGMMGFDSAPQQGFGFAAAPQGFASHDSGFAAAAPQSFPGPQSQPSHPGFAQSSSANNVPASSFATGFSSSGAPETAASSALFVEAEFESSLFTRMSREEETQAFESESFEVGRVPENLILTKSG